MYAPSTSLILRERKGKYSRDNEFIKLWENQCKSTLIIPLSFFKQSDLKEEEMNDLVVSTADLSLRKDMRQMREAASRAPVFFLADPFLPKRVEELRGKKGKRLPKFFHFSVLRRWMRLQDYLIRKRYIMDANGWLLRDDD